jgi:hypothetical protein
MIRAYARVVASSPVHGTVSGVSLCRVGVGQEELILALRSTQQGVARSDDRLNRRWVLGVDHERRLGEDLRAILGQPPLADRGAFARVVMPVDPEEDERPAPLRLRDPRVVLREAEDRGDARRVVAGRVEPAVAVRFDNRNRAVDSVARVSV